MSENNCSAVGIFSSHLEADEFCGLDWTRAETFGNTQRIMPADTNPVAFREAI